MTTPESSPQPAADPDPPGSGTSRPSQGRPGSRNPSDGPPRFGTLIVTVAVVVGLLLGYAAGWLTPQLTTPDDDSVEAGFARDMIIHHAQAVEMGLIGFQRAADPNVRQVAVDIATNQQGEIGMMHAWLTDWGLDPTGSNEPMAWLPESSRHKVTGHRGDSLMPGMATADEMATLRTASGKSLDVLFLQLMIRHHLGGTHMLDAVLAASALPPVTNAAQTMRDAQQTELANLKQLLTRLGGAPLPAN